MIKKTKEMEEKRIKEEIIIREERRCEGLKSNSEKIRKKKRRVVLYRTV